MTKRFVNAYPAGNTAESCVYDTGCIGKVAFKELRYAQQASKRKQGRRPYKCNVCGMYHVGGNYNKAPRRKFKRPTPQRL